MLEKCEEKYWPTGLSNLFQREQNFDYIKLFNCRKLKSENIVVIISSDNSLMPNYLVDKKFGFIVVFRKDVFV